MSRLDPEINKHAKELLELAKISSDINLITPINNGKNNQVFKVQCKNKKNYIYKKYYKNINDQRNRLINEYNFLKNIHCITPNQTPEPLALNESENIALYEFIEGKIFLNSKEITMHEIGYAAEFIKNINTKINFELTKFPHASESFFSILEHINHIDNRIKELSLVNNKLLNNLLYQISKYWESEKTNIIRQCKKYDINIYANLKDCEKILSPSDFGFHNAIRKNDNSIAFIDFEYAGLDDPAKLVCDFFGQVNIKIDIKYYNIFIDNTFSQFDNYENIKNRSRILNNAFKIKWCCIVLNIFLEKNLNRRLFSNQNLDIEKLKYIQINKAVKILKELEKPNFSLDS